MSEINKILLRLSRISIYFLAGFMVLYFISGYGMTKNIIDPVFAKSLHEKWLPIPTVLFIILHVSFPLKIALIKRIRDEAWVNIYLLIFDLIIFVVFLYLYLL